MRYQQGGTIMQVVRFDRIKELIADTGKTLVELSTDFNSRMNEFGLYITCSDSSLDYYSKGTRTPKPDMIYALAKYFNVSADYLLGLTAIATTDTDIKNACEVTGLSEDIIDVLQRYQYCFADKAVNVDGSFVLLPDMEGINFVLYSLLYADIGKVIGAEASPVGLITALTEYISACKNARIAIDMDIECEIEESASNFNASRLLELPYEYTSKYRVIADDYYHNFISLIHDNLEITNKQIIDKWNKAVAAKSKPQNRPASDLNAEDNNPAPPRKGKTMSKAYPIGNKMTEEK
jgi:transcriptional regulator with XRE-family HTH domain